jgi:hypothetical protein
MRLSFRCAGCGCTASVTAANTDAGAKKLRWTRKGIDYLCPKCYKPKGKPRVNSKHVKDGAYTFDSEAEHRYYHRLLLRVRNGEICDLEVHPKFVIQPAFVDDWKRPHKPVTFELDFAYTDSKGVRHVEDVKAYLLTDRAQALMPIVQCRYRGMMFRFVDEFGNDWKKPKPKPKKRR